MNATTSISRAAARRFLVRAFQLERPRALRDPLAALDALGFVQMDSINVCGRVHDLILRARVRDYAPEQLDELLYGPSRAAFEYYFPNLCVLPLRDYPYFVRSMRARAAAPGRRHGLSAEEAALAEQLVARIAAEGPLRTRAGGNGEGLTLSGWGVPRRIGAHVLEKLWLQGRLSVGRRVNFERWYELTERALPGHLAALHEDGAALPTPEEERVWRARTRLRARRLFRPSRDDVRALGEHSFARVDVQGSARPWFVLADELSALTAGESAPPVEPEVSLLAPLDPLVYDRARTRELFDFEYVWEVYTPAAKRRWGYYVLPILWGDRFAGRVDPRIDRRGAALHLRGLHFEPAVDAAEIATPLGSQFAELARFLGAKRIVLEPTRPALPRNLRQRLTSL